MHRRETGEKPNADDCTSNEAEVGENKFCRLTVWESMAWSVG